MKNALYAALLFAALFAGRAVAQETSRPNIIFLLADDQRWDTIGTYGNPHIHTPNLDRLAEEGTVFDYAFVTTSICATSRASILTGQYARRHRIWDFRSELTGEQLEKSYLGVLKNAGYRIGFIGKWGIGEPPREFFDYDRSFPGQGQYWVETDGRRRHLTSIMADQAVEFISRYSSPDVPFCLSLSFKAAHVQDSYSLADDPFPYDPAMEGLYQKGDLPLPVTARHRFYESLPTFLKNSEARLRWAIRFWGPARTQKSLKGYYRLISGIDAAVGRIMQALKESGTANRTAIIFTGDNGFYLGEYGLAGKWFAHEPSIRVPLVIRLPERRNQVRRNPGPALNIDIAPTIIDLAGLPVPDKVQGVSLLRAMSGSGERPRSEFFYEHLFEHPRIPKSEAVRTRRWKYIRYLEMDPVYEELYDLEQDPLETRNLASDPASRTSLERMREKLEKWRRIVE